MRNYSFISEGASPRMQRVSKLRMLSQPASTVSDGPSSACISSRPSTAPTSPSISTCPPELPPIEHTEVAPYGAALADSSRSFACSASRTPAKHESMFFSSGLQNPTESPSKSSCSLAGGSNISTPEQSSSSHRYFADSSMQSGACLSRAFLPLSSFC